MSRITEQRANSIENFTNGLHDLIDELYESLMDGEDTDELLNNIIKELKSNLT